MKSENDKAIQAYVLSTLDAETQRLVTLAGLDLWFGPIGDVDDNGKPWPGFSKAVDQIKANLDVGELWVDADCGHVLTEKPEAEEIDGELVEPLWECIIHYGKIDVMRVAFGELAEYLR